jgi:hypothetical protein
MAVVSSPERQQSIGDMASIFDLIDSVITVTLVTLEAELPRQLETPKKVFNEAKR